MILSRCSSDSPVLWVRLDPDVTLLREIITNQPDYQWQLQLKYERDVCAQFDSIAALESFPTAATRNALTDIIENENMYVNVRCKATHCLTKVRCLISCYWVAFEQELKRTTAYFITLQVANAMVTNWVGPSVMLAIFKKMYGSYSCPQIVKQNNFTNLQHYMMQKVSILI